LGHPVNIGYLTCLATFKEEQHASLSFHSVRLYTIIMAQICQLF